MNKPFNSLTRQILTLLSVFLTWEKRHKATAVLVVLI